MIHSSFLPCLQALILYSVHPVDMFGINASWRFGEKGQNCQIKWWVCYTFVALKKDYIDENAILEVFTHMTQIMIILPTSNVRHF